MIIFNRTVADSFSTLSLRSVNTISIDLQSSFDIDCVLKVDSLIFSRRLEQLDVVERSLSPES